MNIVLITQGVSHVVLPLFNSKYKIVGILESMPRGFIPKKSRNVFRKLIRIFFRRNSLSSFCKKNKIPYNFICKGRDDEVKSWLNSIKPDLIVIRSMSQLISEEIIEIPKYGTINVHSSFLPEYRGPNPAFWQYYDFETNHGVTIHYVDKGEDTGDIILQERVRIPIGTRAQARLDILIGVIGVPLLLRAIELIESKQVAPIKQSLESPTKRARNIKKEEHKEVIDWNNWTIEHIWNVLRGTELYLNAIRQPTGLYYGQRWSIQDYDVFPNQKRKFGTIYKSRGRNCIAVKEGCIYIKCHFSFKKTIKGLLNRIIK